MSTVAMVTGVGHFDQELNLQTTLMQKSYFCHKHPERVRHEPSHSSESRHRQFYVNVEAFVCFLVFLLIYFVFVSLTVNHQHWLKV